MACWWCGGIIRNRSRPSFILTGQNTLHYTGGPTGRRGRRRGGGGEEKGKLELTFWNTTLASSIYLASLIYKLWQCRVEEFANGLRIVKGLSMILFLYFSCAKHFGSVHLCLIVDLLQKLYKLKTCEENASTYEQQAPLEGTNPGKKYISTVCFTKLY